MTIKTSMIRIPRRFYDDHCERDLPAPPVLKATSKHYYICGLPTSMLDELLDDADYYSHAIDCYPGSGMEYLSGIVSSARATAKAIRKARA